MDTPSDDNAMDADHSHLKAPKSHIRAYQACMQCRQKKQKCDLGPVDNPHPPPCASCLREGKLCTFSKTRSRSSNQGTPLHTPKVDPGVGAISLPEPALVGVKECLEKKAKTLSEPGLIDPGRCLDLLGDLRGTDWDDRGPINQQAGDIEYLQLVLAAKQSWVRFEPIHNGLLTAFEAMAYVEFFYAKLWPLTATPLADYRDLSKHPSLLKDEPVLAVTLLTIASRYAPLAGRGGKTRSVIVHDRISQYLRDMLERLNYAEEPVSGYNIRQTYHTETKLRSLGAIEALLLLMDWNPRSTHYPMKNGSNLLDSSSDDEHNTLQNETKARIRARIFEGYKTSKEKRATFLKPCWKSDQMCLSYLNLAMLIAFQARFFIKDPLKPNAYMVSIGETLDVTGRRNRIRCLLFVHAAFLSGRLSIPSLYPKEHTQLQFASEVVDTAHGLPKRSVPSDDEVDRSEFARDVAIYFWYRLAYDVVLPANDELFPSKEHSHQLVRSGEYTSKMHAYLTELDDFKSGLDKCKFIPKLLRYNLTIDYEYCRVFIANFGLQAVAWRFANSGQHILNLINRRAILSSIIGSDQKYIVEVVNSSRNVLRLAVQKLEKFNALRLAIHRVFLRIISVSTLLLQAFMFGTTRDECQQTLNILYETVQSLGRDEMDDMHVAAPIADALGGLLKDVQQCLVRITPSFSQRNSLEVQPVVQATRRGRGRSSSQTPTRSRRNTSNNQHINDNLSLPGQFSNLSTSAPVASDYGMGSLASGIPQPDEADPGIFVMPPLMGANDIFDLDINTPTVGHTQPSEWYGLPLDPLMEADTGFGSFHAGHTDGQINDILNTLVYTSSPGGLNNPRNV